MQKNLQQMTDNELALAVASGSRAEFDEIVKRYCRPLTAFAIARTNSTQNAEDIVQDTFLKAFKNINSFDDKYTLKNWLFTIAYRLIITQYRKKTPQLLAEKKITQLTYDKQDSQENQWLWQEAHQLGPQAFTLLWLFYKQQMTTSEIAVIMKKTKVMVRVMLHRTRKSLAKQIEARKEANEKSKPIRKQNICLERG